jgi:hypothetical protein
VFGVAGVGDADARGDQVHESELHGVQVSADQGAPVAQGMVAGVFVWARASVVWLQGGSLLWGCVWGGPGGVGGRVA